MQISISYNLYSLFLTDECSEWDNQSQIYMNENAGNLNLVNLRTIGKVTEGKFVVNRCNSCFTVKQTKFRSTEKVSRPSHFRLNHRPPPPENAGNIAGPTGDAHEATNGARAPHFGYPLPHIFPLPPFSAASPRLISHSQLTYLPIFWICIGHS